MEILFDFHVIEDRLLFKNAGLKDQRLFIIRAWKYDFIYKGAAKKYYIFFKAVWLVFNTFNVTVVENELRVYVASPRENKFADSTVVNDRFLFNSRVND